MCRKAILILGMHRSGTSAITGALRHLGLRLPADLMPGDRNNGLGYFESLRVNSLMERLLHAANSRWHDWRSLDLSAASPPAVKEIRDELLRLLVDEGREEPLLGVKDPRICRAVPFWLDLLREIGREPVAVLVLRQPLEIAKSLSKRDGMPMDKALLLWLRHLLDAERNTRSIPRVFVEYDELMRDWAVVANRISAALSFEWPTRAQAVADEITGFVRSELRHWKTDGDLSGLSGAPWFQNAWTLLQACSKDSERRDHEFDSITTAFELGSRPFQQYFSLIETSLELAQRRNAEATAALDKARWMLGALALEGAVEPRSLQDAALTCYLDELNLIKERISRLEIGQANDVRVSVTDL